MADKNLTIFQRLERALSNSWSSEQGSIPHINSYDLTGNKSVLYKAKDKEDYDKTKLEMQQNSYLKNRWVKANVNLSVGAFAGLSNVKLMYRDAELMDAFPEIGAALDLVSEESCLTGDKGQIVNVYSKSDRIKAILEDLFVNRLNLQVTAPMVIRGMCKYGNQFQLLDIDRTVGVKGWKQLPVFNVDRIEFGIQNPYSAAYATTMNKASADMSTKFVWTEENDSQVPFRDWQIAHFRLLTNSMYLPYGCSYLNSARRHFRMLSLMEDMMLIYRLERSIERRVFKIYVGNIDDADVSAYIEEIANNFKRTPIIDPMTGQIDLRKNIMPVHKDTPIPLMDGRTIPISELAKEYSEGKINYVYSVQDKTHQIVPGKVVWCGKNYTADKLVKITLDDGSYSIMAPEHEVIMRDGSKKRADEIQDGESVMPFYRKNAPIAKGCVSEYETVYNPHTGKYEFTHRLVGKCIHKGNIKANVIHHADFDRFNNSPSNLKWMTWKEHSAYHASLSNDPLIREMRRKSTAAAWMDEEKRKKHIRNITTEFDKHVWETIDNEVSKGHISTQNMLIEFINSNLMDYLLEHNSNGKIHHFKKITKPLFKARLHDRGFRNITEYFAYMEANVDGLDISRTQSLRRSKRAKDSEAWKNFHNVKKDAANVNGDVWEGVRRGILNGSITKEGDIVEYTRTSKNAVRAYIREQYGNVSSVEYIASMKKNHKVTKTEWTEGDDVYCMTVVGLYGEEDRHNFAVRTWASDGSVGESGMFVSNCVDQDFFIPVRTQDAPNPIETLPAAQNLTAMDDIKFVQNKVLTALRIPKTFLNFEEAAGEGKNLALMDIRFTRVINRIQQAFLMELTKIASIHLYLLGFEDDLTNFNLTMNNPSTQAEQLEIENIQKKISAIRDAVSDPGNGLPIMSLTRALKQIMKFTDNEIKENLEEIRLKKGIAAELEKTAQIIKRTGLFDNVDRMYGEPGAEYIDDTQQGGPNGGLGGGGMPSGGGSFGSGLDSLGSPGMDDMGDINGQEGTEPTKDMGGGMTPPSGTESTGATGSTPDAGDTGKTANEAILRASKPLLSEGRTIIPRPINKASEGNLLEAYMKRLDERSENKINEDKVITERSAIYDKTLLINEEFNKMIQSLSELSDNEDDGDNE